MSKFRKRVLKGLKNILDHSSKFRCGPTAYMKSLIPGVQYSGLGICDVNRDENVGKVFRDTEKYLSLYFSGDEYNWKLGEIAPREKWLKKHISRLEKLE